MIKGSELENIVATRTLDFIFTDGNKEAFIVNIGIPTKTEEDYCCVHEVLSKTTRKTFKIFGIDSIQALDLSIKSISSYLESIERARNGKFYFLGEVGHCFPK